MAKTAQKKAEEKAGPAVAETPAERQARIAELEKQKDTLQLKFGLAESVVKHAELAGRAKGAILSVLELARTLAQAKQFFCDDAGKKSMGNAMAMLACEENGLKILRPDKIIRAGALARQQELPWDVAEIERAFSDGVRVLEAPLGEMLDSTHEDASRGADRTGILNEFINHSRMISRLAFIKALCSDEEEAGRITALAKKVTAVIANEGRAKGELRVAWVAIDDLVKTRPAGEPKGWVGNLRRNLEGIDSCLADSAKRHGEAASQVNGNENESIALQERAEKGKLDYKAPEKLEDAKKDMEGFGAELDAVKGELNLLYGKEAVRDTIRNYRLFQNPQ